MLDSALHEWWIHQHSGSFSWQQGHVVSATVAIALRFACMGGGPASRAVHGDVVSSHAQGIHLLFLARMLHGMVDRLTNNGSSEHSMVSRQVDTGQQLLREALNDTRASTAM